MKEIILKKLADVPSELTFSEDTKLLVLSRPTESTNKKIELTVLHENPGLETHIEFRIAVEHIDVSIEVLVKIESNNPETNTYLKLHALSLSSGNKISLVPSLEIKNKEVQAGHGAVIGYVNQLDLHYLASRGLSEKQANNLILDSFLTH